MAAALLLPMSEAASAANKPTLAKAVKSASAKSLRNHAFDPSLRSGAAAKGQEPGSTARGRIPTHGTVTVMVQLDAAPAATAFKQSLSRGAATARSASKLQSGRVSSMAASVRSRFSQAATRATPLYQVHALYSGIAIRTDASRVAAIRRIPGVKAVHLMTPKKIGNAVTVPLIGADAAWGATGETGQGVRIGIVDTGIDYTHADFGGPGTVAAFDAAKATSTATPNPALFGPGHKVVGGTDLVGDAYDPGSPDPAKFTPHPDPNPLDCNGHGSHVAGTAAGFGENADGSTFGGPYNANTATMDFKIGPGVAPEASLYAIRVFGCDGSTNVVGAALDFAADPNHDGDVSDHLDVVNMSLGADFGAPDDPDSVATNEGSALGINMAVAAGNGGDLYDIGGSPGNAVRAIGVAASNDSTSVVDALRVNAPPAIAGDYPAEESIAFDWAHSPPVTGDVYKMTDQTNLDGCKPFSTVDAAGVAGKIAFLEWTDNDAVRRCGSVARGGNARRAGAIGAIFADDENTFAAGITGDSLTPDMLIIKSAGDAIRAQLVAGTTVNATMTHALHNTQRIVVPGDTDRIADFSSRGIRANGNVKPDVTAPGVSVFSAAVGTGNDGVSESGTSMATPHIAGTAALVQGMHPTWTTEQVKADIMNTAGQDVFVGPNHTGNTFAPGRVGAGRVKVDAALANDVLAYSAPDATHPGTGAVSVSFGPLAVTAPLRLTRTIRVQNTSSLVTHALSAAYVPATTVPGVTYSVSPASVTLDPRSSKVVTLTLSIPNPRALDRSEDPTLEKVQAGVAREFVTEASGRVVFHPTTGGGPDLRVPVYSAPRPASKMSGTAQQIPAGAGIRSANIALSGLGVSQGAQNGGYHSLVSGFEMAAVSPAIADPAIAFDKAADIRSVGVASNAPFTARAGGNPITNLDTMLSFAVSGHGPWPTAASQVEYDVLIDGDGDGVPDYVIFNTRLTGTDVLVAVTVDLNTGDTLDAELLDGASGAVDTDKFDSDTIVLPVATANLPLLRANARFHWSVESFDENGFIDSVGENNATIAPSLTFNAANPGYFVSNGTSGDLLYTDLNGNSLVLRKDVTQANLDKPLGVLLVHYHNTDLLRAQAVRVTQAQAFNIPAADRKAHSIRAGAFNLGITSTSGKPVTVTRDPRSAQVCSLSGQRVTPHNVGNCILRLSVAGDSMFTAATATLSIPITK